MRCQHNWKRLLHRDGFYCEWEWCRWCGKLRREINSLKSDKNGYQYVSTTGQY